jgi:hypothetical protein
MAGAGVVTAGAPDASGTVPGGTNRSNIRRAYNPPVTISPALHIDAVESPWSGKRARNVPYPAEPPEWKMTR